MLIYTRHLTHAYIYYSTSEDFLNTFVSAEHTSVFIFMSAEGSEDVSRSSQERPPLVSTRVEHVATKRSLSVFTSCCFRQQLPWVLWVCMPSIPLREPKCPRAVPLRLRATSLLHTTPKNHAGLTVWRLKGEPESPEKLILKVLVPIGRFHFYFIPVPKQIRPYHSTTCISWAEVCSEVPEDSRVLKVRHLCLPTSDHLQTWLIPSRTTRSRQKHKSTIVWSNLPSNHRLPHFVFSF